VPPRAIRAFVLDLEARGTAYLLPRIISDLPM
jgi:hypothetical protein